MRLGRGESLTDAVTVVPANRSSCDDLQTVFGTRGAGAFCQCQRYKLGRKEAFSKFPVEERMLRLQLQTHCGDPAARTTSGLVAYLGDEPVGWCAVEPRPAYEGLVRVYRVPWEGRTEDRADPDVWSVTCIFTRAGYRRRGISYALARSAVDHARRSGARALEAYPMVTEPGQEIAWDEVHVGTQRVFAAAGFREVNRPSKRRAVMRIDFDREMEGAP